MLDKFATSLTKMIARTAMLLSLDWADHSVNGTLFQGALSVTSSSVWGAGYEPTKAIDGGTYPDWNAGTLYSS